MTAEPLPPPELRRHILAAAIRAADAELIAHGWDPTRSLEVLDAAIADALVEDAAEQADDEQSAKRQH